MRLSFSFLSGVHSYQKTQQLEITSISGPLVFFPSVETKESTKLNQFLKNVVGLLNTYKVHLFVSFIILALFIIFLVVVTDYSEHAYASKSVKSYKSTTVIETDQNNY